jgi:hypothetical protein
MLIITAQIKSTSKTSPTAHAAADLALKHWEYSAASKRVFFMTFVNTAAY